MDNEFTDSLVIRRYSQGSKNLITIDKERSTIMSQEEARKVVSKAVTDEEFRKTLFSDPDKALSGYDLNEDEVGALRAIPAETIDDFANNLDERISMSFFAFGAELFGSEVHGGSVAAGGTTEGGSVAASGTAEGSDYYGSVAQGGSVAASGTAEGSDYYGSAAEGGSVAASGTAAGSDYYGSAAEGGSVAAGGSAQGGSVAAGGESFGGVVAGGEFGISQKINWLQRLANALGIGGGTGGAGSEKNVY